MGRDIVSSIECMDWFLLAAALSQQKVNCNTTHVCRDLYKFVMMLFIILKAWRKPGRRQRGDDPQVLCLHQLDRCASEEGVCVCVCGHHSFILL